MSSGEAESELGGAESRAIAEAVREELARRRMSRQGLADLARISISTLEKALAGRRAFTLATTVRLEEALGLRLRPVASAPAEAAPQGFAPPELGSYSRPAMRWIEGAYLTLRPSFEAPGAIFAYRTDVRWSEETSRMVFQEGERTDAPFAQHGEIAAPHQSGHIYFVTNRNGQHRLVTLGRPAIDGVMRGVLSTLQAGRGAQLIPIAAPITLAPFKAGEPSPPLGRILPGAPRHGEYRDLLDRVKAEGFAILL